MVTEGLGSGTCSGRDMEIDDRETTIAQSPSFAKGVKKIKLDQEPPKGEQPQPPEVLPSSSGVHEFQFPQIDLQNFLKSGKSNSVTDILEILTTPTSNFVNHQKRENMSTAELCPVLRRPRLVVNKGNIKSLYGFEIDAETYLHPEEALYLMEIGKLEVLTEGVPLSVERARLLFLQSSQIPSCAAADYAVYKHFSKLGYRVQRRGEYLSPYPAGQEATETENVMEEDKDLISASTKSSSSSSMDVGSSRGTKRRAEGQYEQDTSESDCSSSVKSTDGGAGIVADDDSDCEFLEEVENVSKPDPEELVFGEVSMDLPVPPSPPSPKEPYIVVEFDSDVEFVDEVSHFDVVIEELSYEVDYCEAGPSTSKGIQAFVDLVSSDSEAEEASEYYEPIWSKCVPTTTKIQFWFPPSGLLPQNILPRDVSTVYEYNLLHHPQEDASDLEIIDNLRIDGNVTPTFESSGSSWKEWRQNAMEEAKHVIKDSLLGKPDPSPSVTDSKCWYIGNRKLHQWTPPTAAEAAQARRAPRSLHMPYDLYPQSAVQVHRDKLGVIVKPIHRIAVVGSQELVPDVGNFPTDEEEPPLLVTVVGEDANVVQLLCNAVPIPSLFEY